MMEAQRSSEMSVLTRATQRNIPEYGILYFIIYLSMGLEWNQSTVTAAIY
jgi:hypothetical protein